MRDRFLTHLLLVCMCSLSAFCAHAQVASITRPLNLPTDAGVCTRAVLPSDTTAIILGLTFTPALHPVTQYSKTTVTPAVGMPIAKGSTMTITVEVWNKLVPPAMAGTMVNSKDFLFTIVDTEKPIITVSDLTRECDDVTPYTGATASDNCGGVINPTYAADVVTTLACPKNQDILRTWTATDADGNTSTKVQKITIRDTKKPNILFPALLNGTDKTIDCDTDANIEAMFKSWADAHAGAIATDNCTIDSKLVWSYSPTTLPPPNCTTPTIGVYRSALVTFTVIDECGNMNTMTGTFMVKDDVKPTPSCPSDIVVNTNVGQCEYTLCPPIINVIDDCSGSTIKYSYDLDGGAKVNLLANSLFPCVQLAIGVHIVKYYVTDCAGNEATCSYKITVQDKEKPTFTCPTLAPVPNEAGKCTAAVALPMPTNIDDKCGFATATPVVKYSATGATTIVQNTLTATTAEVFNIGTTVITYEIEDKYANKGICTFNVVVEDKVAPTAKCKPSFVFYVNPAGITPDVLTVAMIDDGSTDNSCIPDLTISPMSFPCAPPSANPILTIVTLTVKDKAGNTNTCTTTVRTENTPPVPTYQLGICGNDKLQLFANAPTGTFTYRWDGPNGFVSFDKNPIKNNLTALNSGTYKVEITGFSGCKSVGAVEVTIPNNIVTPRLRGLPNYCEASTIELRTDVTNADTYIWTAPNFSKLITTNNMLTLTATAANAGYWTVVTIKNNCSSYESEPFQVNIEARPTVVVSNNSPVCIGNDIQLSVRTTPGASYQWTGPASFSSLEQNPKIVNAAASGTYSVTVTSIGGCTNMGATNTVVNNRPSITALSTDAPVCVSGTENVKIQPTLFPINNGAYQFRWTGTNGFTSTDSVPVLPNVTAANNGTYTLVVKNAFGCESQPRSVVVGMKNIPQTPVLASTYGPYCQGDNFTLTTTNLSGTQVEYMWRTPLGFFPTQTPSFSINNSTINNKGNYSVAAMVDGCTSKNSAIIPIEVNAKPATPIINANNLMVCEGAAIELSTDLITGAKYAWTGPAGFTASVYNPTVLPSRPENAGTYTVQVSVKNCLSDISIPKNIVVHAVPKAPLVKNNSPICGDNPASPLVLSIVLSSALPGASYSWYYAKTNARIAPSASNLNLNMSDLTNYAEGNHDFYAITTVNGCASANSVPTTVTINRIPQEKPYAGASQRVCDGTAIMLEAKKPTIGTGAWSVNSATPTIISPNSESTEIKNLRTGQSYLFYWTLSNGECKNYNRDSISIIIDTNTEKADAGRDSSVCGVTSLNLYAQTPMLGGMGTWSQSAVQEALGIKIQSINTPNSMVTGMVPGNTYAFKWTLNNRGCKDFASDEVIIRVASKNDKSDAGKDFTTCSADAVLNAAPPQAATGTWKSEEAGISIASSSLPNTRVNNLKVGKNKFIWTLQNIGCGSYSSDTLFVTYEKSVLAVPDVYEVNFTGRIDLDVAANDTKPTGFTITTKNLPTQGTLMDKGKGVFTYDPSPSFLGEDRFDYLLCSPTCPTACATGTVTFKVGANATCQVPTIITPNNDGMNDAFVVPCLYTAGYPENELSIFNQWGDEVFHAKPYKNDWSGLYDGEDLPAGTYYYIVKFVLGREAKTGFIMIQR